MTALPDADREAEKTKRQPIVSADPPPTDDRVSAHRNTARRSLNVSNLTIEASNRTIDEINRDEIMAAIRDVFKTGESLDPDIAITDIARVLGFRRTGSQIRKAFKSAINGAIRRGLLEYNDHIIRRNR